MEIADLLKQAEKIAGMKMLKRDLERAISAIQVTGDFWKITDIANLCVPVASAIVEVLLNKDMVHINSDEDIILTDKGKNFAKTQGIYPLRRYICEGCEGRGIPFYADLDLYRRFVQLTKERPSPLQKYDQAYVTPETTVSRVLFMESKGDLRGKKIIVLGAEDDLLGLAIALSGKAKEVYILDIDQRLIEFDREIFNSLGIDNAYAEVMDLRIPLPEELIGRFDVFVSDPPETISALKAFVGKGIATLRDEGGAGYFGLTLRDSSLRRWKEFQTILAVEYGTVITDIVQDFNQYVNWEYHVDTKAAAIAPVKRPPKEIWYRSAWYRIEALPGFKRFNDMIEEDSLYLDEESSTT